MGRVRTGETREAGKNPLFIKRLQEKKDEAQYGVNFNWDV